MQPRRRVGIGHSQLVRQLTEVAHRFFQNPLPFLRRALDRLGVLQKRKDLLGKASFEFKPLLHVDQRLRQRRDGPVQVV